MRTIHSHLFLRSWRYLAIESKRLIMYFFVPSNLPTKLSPLQVSLLRLFEHGITEEQTLELCRMLVKYYSERVAAEAARVDAERGYTAQDFERMLNEPS
jgi:hypothetical protein